MSSTHSRKDMLLLIARAGPIPISVIGFSTATHMGRTFTPLFNSFRISTIS